MTDDRVATKVANDGRRDSTSRTTSCGSAASPWCAESASTAHEVARATPEVSEALRVADGVVIAPSNPFVSVEPILALAGVRDLISAKPTLAVSPIVGGQAIKGPAAKMLANWVLTSRRRASRGATRG